MIGRKIHNYKILEKIGEGGMGIVYKAEDIMLKRIVALKFLHSKLTRDNDAKLRFINEARAISALEHPNICAIHEIKETPEGRIFIVLAYYSGESLQSQLEKRVFDFEEGLNLGLQMISGIKTAHKKGIIHRDIKSSNIMLTDDNLAKIVDFGLAKLATRAGFTSNSTTVGSLAYMSPEHAQGLPVNEQTDIWSFGVVLYEALTGELPFKGEYEKPIIYSILKSTPESIRTLNKSIPKAFEKIILKCLEKDKSRRYQSADEVYADLNKLKEESSSRKRDRAQSLKRIKRHSILTAFILILLFFLINFYGKSTLNQLQDVDLEIVSPHRLTTTTTVFEIDPQISPDGSSLAYVSDENGNMDIWTLQLATGERKNLTEDNTDYDGVPAWSPDGSSIAFFSRCDGYGIYTISGQGGAPRKVISQSEVRSISWAPDGSLISFAAEGILYTVPVSGGKRDRIELPTSCLDHSWAADGEHIVYTAGEYSSRFIYVKRLDNSAPVQVTSTPDLYYTPVWLKDAQKIFFKLNRKGTRDIWWIDVDHQGHSREQYSPLTSGLDIYDFSLSKDLSIITYSRGKKHCDIYAIPAEFSGVCNIEQARQITSENQYKDHLSISHDNNYLAFNSTRSGRHCIWIMDIDGKYMRRISPENMDAVNPRWSPDDSTIAFHFYKNGNSDIYTISVRDESVRQITQTSHNEYYPSWAPDGSNIVFASDQSGNQDIWLQHLDDGTLRQLTMNKAKDHYPSYSRISHDIAFISNRTGTWEIYVLNPHTMEERQLTHIQSTTIIGHTWAIDGKSIFFTHDPRAENPGRKIWNVNVKSGAVHKVLDFTGRDIEGAPLASLATDGIHLYFMRQKHESDIWLGEISH
ncbi:MAG: protein kinase [candidate division KSB1 bacterium]|jgi:serine/threonine protein kinase|nr:protein kinase [candidate division KSB1 bacterium]